MARPIFQVFETPGEIKSTLLGILETREKQYRAFHVPPVTIEEKQRDDTFDDEFIRERVRRGIYERSIREHGVWPNDPKYKEGGKYLRNVKYLPPGKKIVTPMVIWDDKVLIGLFSRDRPQVFVIESNQFASMLKMIFDEMWTVYQTEEEFEKKSNGV